MKVIATKKFEGIRDAERNVYPKEGDIWEVSEKRAEFLQSKGVIEIVEEIQPKKKVEVEEIKEEVKPKKAKTNKKK